MKIENIKINSYGNLKNKEINLKNNINIIYGKNESGKSTLLNFIKNIFYGISKNKDGKEISDYEKYLPWVGEEFSGRIKYELNNKNKYEIYRDFNKKNPKIYDENLNEISSEFKIDKKDGNLFFYEQTGVTKQTYLSTIMAPQQEVVLSMEAQNNLVQKIANLGGTGSESTSFKKAMDRLAKKQLEEVGTSRTQDRPINLLQNRNNELDIVLKDRKNYLEDKYNLQEKKEKIIQKLEEEKQKNKLLKKENNLLITKQIENEKINIKNKIIKENKNKTKNILLILILILLIIINIFNFIFISNKIINSILLIPIPITIILYILNLKNKNKINNISNEINLEKDKNNLEEKLEKSNQKILDYELQLNGVQYEENINSKKIEEIIFYKEEKENIEEQLKLLNEKNKYFNITKELLEKAYNKMKNSVTPKFTQNLSKIVEEISNGKYKKVSIDEEKGLIIELQNGEYIPANILSIGTIDELYLALRLSMINEISEEKMPIILDETFAYFDDDRLKNILLFLQKNLNNHQVILFTCTDREKRALDKLNIEYNLVEL